MRPLYRRRRDLLLAELARAPARARPDRHRRRTARVLLAAARCQRGAGERARPRRRARSSTAPARYHVDGGGPGGTHPRVRQARRRRHPRRRPDTAGRDREGQTVAMATTPAAGRGLRRRVGRIRPDLVPGPYPSGALVSQRDHHVGLAAVILIPTLTDAVTAEGEGAIAQFTAPLRFRLAVLVGVAVLAGISVVWILLRDRILHPPQVRDVVLREVAAGRGRAVPGLRPRRRRSPRAGRSSLWCPPPRCWCWRTCRAFAPRTRDPRGSASSARSPGSRCCSTRTPSAEGSSDSWLWVTLFGVAAAFAAFGSYYGVARAAESRSSKLRFLYRADLHPLLVLGIVIWPARHRRGASDGRARPVPAARPRPLVAVRQEPAVVGDRRRRRRADRRGGGARLAAPADPVRRAAGGRGPRGARQPAPRRLGRGDRGRHGVAAATGADLDAGELAAVRAAAEVRRASCCSASSCCCPGSGGRRRAGSA